MKRTKEPSAIVIRELMGPTLRINQCPEHCCSEETAASILGLKSKATLADWRHNQRHPLPYVKIGRMVRYRFKDLEEFIERRLIRFEDGEV